ncbi:Golgi-associated plant pathogenesis-related protein 1 [Orchesella cincta]|uniref:Golgi-associated plant pathogenesis-related protein 1 n=1 Tax=Orchesella cincta TaxID=48709 RepID=A0A1D2MCS0_ORCCI|nr:Golgi-associated plant pathogenesis-related protein 1 [Orchesella cincta]
MALTTEKKMLLANIGIGLVIVGMLCGYTYVWLNWLDLEDAREAALIWHNFYRSRHGSPPLRRSANLDVIAQMCAENYYRPIGEVDHKCPYRLDKKNYYLYPGTGENGFGVKFGDYSNSDYKASVDSAKILHFSQVLWKDSKEFGFGYTIYYDKDEDKYGALGVFLFYPPGNYYSEDMSTYHQNVGPVLPNAWPIKRANPAG